jgi:hypothetical protein
MRNASWFIGLAAWVQEIRIGISRPSRIEEDKPCRRFRGRVSDGRKNSSENFVLGAVRCFRKRRLAKLNANNPRAIADFHRRWFKTNITGVKRGTAHVLCIRGRAVSKAPLPDEPSRQVACISGTLRMCPV